MASIKVAQKVNSLSIPASGIGSVTMALKSGYIRVTPSGAVGLGATVEVGTDASVTDNNSLFIPANDSVVFKERVSSIQTASVTNASGAIKFGFASGIEAPFAIGDTVEVTGCAPAGINTTSATVSAVTGPDPINGIQSGTVTLNYGDANLSATDAVGEIRRTVVVDVIGVPNMDVHIIEVQNAGGF